MTAIGQTVLLVEDEAAILEGITDFLRRRKFVVTPAGSFREAQRPLGEAPALPDFVITDVRLPDGNGLDIVRDVASREPRPRIIVITGHLDQDAVHHVRAIGADAVLLKPFPLKALLDAIRGAAASVAAAAS